MSEVVVVAVITAKEGKRDEVEALIRDGVLPATHAEPGCVTYALHRDIRDPAKVVFVERWASGDALGEHLQTPHLQAFLAEVQPLSDAPVDVYVLEGCGFGDPAKGTLGGA